MAEIERVYTIPLRDVKKAARWKRSKKAVSLVRDYLSRHLKAEHVSLDSAISEAIWSRGSEKPPRRIRVRAVKFEDGHVEAELSPQ